MRSVWSVALITMLAACSSQPRKPATVDEMIARIQDSEAPESQKEIICTVEVPVGSSLKQKRCTTAAQREALRRQADQLVIVPGRGIAR